MAGVFTGAPRLRGSLQPSAVRSITHRSMSGGSSGLGVAVLPGAGRSEAKKSRLPSGEIVGLESLKRPEKGATSGSLQRPPARCETQIAVRAGVVVVGERNVK